MRLIQFIILLIISPPVFGQKTALTGKVICDDKALKGVTVAIQHTAFATATDSVGFFSIANIPPGTYQLIASAVGYETKFIQISIRDTTLFVPVDLMAVIHMHDVVVTGTLKEISRSESPVPVELYAKKFFKANPTPSVFEALQLVNGVRPQLNCNVCNTGDIHINGLEGPYTMILIDGMPLVSGLSTVYGLTGIPQSLVERIEIVKGPAAALYGSEAVGGLINIITRKPEHANAFSADIFSSHWGDINTDLGFKWNMGKKIQSLTGINYFNYQQPIDNNKDGFTDVTLQHRISLFNKWQIQRKHQRIFSFAGRYLNEDRWGGQMNWTPAYRGGDSIYGESIYTNRWEFMSVYQLPVKEKIMLQLSANGHYQNSVYGATFYQAKQYIGFGQLTWNKPIHNHDLTAGLAWRYTWYDDNTTATGQQDSIRFSNNPSVSHLPGIFLQDQIKTSENTTLLLAARYDYNSIHGHVFTPRINLKIKSNNNASVWRFGLGNGYRVVNIFTEDHAALTGARQVVIADELKPERSWNGTINYTRNLSVGSIRTILDASIFYTYFSNRILPDYTTNANQIIYKNLDGFAVSKGVSINADISLHKKLKAMLGATWLDVSINENGDRYRQPLTERFSAVWTISYQLSKNFSVDYTGNIYGKMILPLLGQLDNRPAQSPVWSIQNLQCTKKISSQFEVYGGFKNLLNFTPPSNSIARAFDPFDKQVVFDNQGQVVATPDNPNALSFDPNYMFAPNQGRRFFLGLRFFAGK